MSGPISWRTPPPPPTPASIESGYALGPLLFSAIGCVALSVVLVLTFPHERQGAPSLTKLQIALVAVAVAAVFMVASTFDHPERWARMFLHADGMFRSQMGIMLALGITFVRLRSAPTFAFLEVLVGFCGLAFGDDLATADDGPVVQLVTFAASVMLLATGFFGLWPTFRRFRASVSHRTETE